MTQGKPAVLLVDDVEANLAELRVLLSTMNCQLVQARSGSEALHELRQREFAVMLLDAHMPEMSGFEVARRMRQSAGLHNVPIIFLTAMQPTEDNMLLGYQSGGVDFLFKPVNPTILRVKVRIFLELYASHKIMIAAQAQALELDAARRVSESRRLLLDELTQKNVELQRANVELEQFAYIASHDLREPLRMVSTYAHLISKLYKNALDERGREFLGFAEEGAKRMQQLIEDLLLYVRVHHEDADHVALDMGAVVEEIVARFRPVIDACGGELHIGELPVVMGCRSQLVLVMQNLISNATKFRNLDPLRIDIWATNEGREWVFAVRDTGIGIDPSFTERAFQIFQRYHVRDEYPGVGLGLSIARRVVHYHGGRIWVDSTLGQGSTFYFTLPKRGE